MSTVTGPTSTPSSELILHGPVRRSTPPKPRWRRRLRGIAIVLAVIYGLIGIITACFCLSTRDFWSAQHVTSVVTNVRDRGTTSGKADDCHDTWVDVRVLSAHPVSYTRAGCAGVEHVGDDDFVVQQTQAPYRVSSGEVMPPGDAVVFTFWAGLAVSLPFCLIVLLATPKVPRRSR